MKLGTSGLQSRDTNAILDTIDKLRQQGIGSILQLPQIIVCGDQSSGKSSVLNALSGLRFPSRDGLCTRFATEVIMRPGVLERIHISIVPGRDCSSGERSALEAFSHSDVDLDDIENVIDRAAKAMGIDPNNPRARRFSDDILRFEVIGPCQPSLTLVDLPGLFRAGTVNQTKADMKSVNDLVQRYMGNKRSVILAVVSAKSDFVVQSVTELSSKEDPDGMRTLGIITKPDKLDVGSEGEKNFVDLAQNRLKYLHLGWHVLVNRDHATKSSTQDERDTHEKKFLSEGVWAKISANRKGIFSLRNSLSGTLQRRILHELPDLIKEAEQEASRCRAVLADLGAPRASLDDSQRYLTQAANAFSVIMRSGVDGSYTHKFFSYADLDSKGVKRLRAFVQATLVEFSEEMRNFGHATHIVSDGTVADGGEHPNQVTQSQFEENILHVIKHSRGRELTTTYNAMIVRDLFQAQSVPWKKLTDKYRLKLVEAVSEMTDLVLSEVTDETTKVRLRERVIKPRFEGFVSSLDEMISRLLNAHLYIHPITYNRNLATAVARAKQEKANREIVSRYKKAAEILRYKDVEDLLKALLNDIPLPISDAERLAASEAIFEMRAYYKIAKDTFVDNFSTLAVEDCLISQVPDLLTPDVIAALDEKDVFDVARESKSAKWERDQADGRLALCESALDKLRSLRSASISDGLNYSRSNLNEHQEWHKNGRSEYRDGDDNDLRSRSGLDSIHPNGDSVFSAFESGVSEVGDEQRTSSANGVELENTL